MGILKWVVSAILRLFVKRLEADIIKKSLPIILTFLFGLIGLIFLALAAINFAEMFLPNYLAKLILAVIFFILAIIFKLRW